MDIVKVSDPKVAKELKQFFTEDGLYCKDEIYQEIFGLMTFKPNDIAVIVLRDDGELKGFAMATVEANREYIWISQAWYNPNCKRIHGKQAINMLKQWAIEEHNKHEIRFETERSPRAIKRAWGFKVHSYIMKCEF